MFWYYMQFYCMYQHYYYNTTINIINTQRLSFIVDYFKGRKFLGQKIRGFAVFGPFRESLCPQGFSK